MTVSQALSRARAVLAASGVDSPGLDAAVLLGRCLDVSREQLIARPEVVLGEDEERAFGEMVARRSLREPVAYIVGKKEFYGRDFMVNEHVLIPRPESELLVELTCARAPRGARVFEVGAGSGAVICSILAQRKDVTGMASDVDIRALKVARANAVAVGVAERLLLYAGRTLGGFASTADVIVSNPPYVTDEEMEGLPEDVRRYEPQAALSGGKDGLGVVKEIIAQATGRLAPHGELVMEVGHGQRDSVEGLFEGMGIVVCGWMKDLSGCDRVVIGVRRDG
jgi:release factor glutamine methyltransferase